MTPKQTIAIFDLDGTITSRDTFLDIIYVSFGVMRFLNGCLLFFPALLRFIFKLGDNPITIEKVFGHFFKDMPFAEYEALCAKYALQRIDRLLLPKILDKISWHQKQGHTLLIISASLENWIIPWAEKNGFERVIATQPEIKEGRLTGCFNGAYCFHEEKITRFEKLYPHRGMYTIYSYGDSKTDMPLLDYSDFGCLV